MKLAKLWIKGFKCFKDLTEIPINKLSILIGENDSGKSTILKSLEYLLTKKSPLQEEFYESEGYKTTEMYVEGEFKMESQIPDALKYYMTNNKIIIRKEFELERPPIIKVKYGKITDQDLYNYESMQASHLKALLIKYSLPAQQNQDLRRQAIKQYIESNYETLPKTIDYYEVSSNLIQPYLPLFEYYSSSDYGNPKSLVLRTLNSVYRSQFYNENGELKTKSFEKLKERLEEKLNTQIQHKLQEKIKKYNNKVTSVKGNFSIDFAKGFVLDDLCLDEGHGYKLIEHKGEGSKKRLFLSILEWDKEIQSQVSQNLIRVYDEPDANLHYDAQRKIFYAIKETSDNPKLSIQNIIATHSLSMIDRASASIINHVKIEDGVSSVEYLKDEGDSDVKKFLEEISEISGMKNSSIFYEKCFLIVEGDTEENAIPKLYRKYFNRSLIEDGVVIINIESNGSWKSFLKLLNKNKESVTLMLLDSDTQNSDSGAKVTLDKVTEIGFSEGFKMNNIFFAGNQEFEDLFPDSLIRDLFNILYPKSTRGKWTIKHIRELRNNYPKISKGFKEYAIRYISHHNKRYNKPEFASQMADMLLKKHIDEMQVIVNLFNKIQEIVTS